MRVLPYEFTRHAAVLTFLILLAHQAAGQRPSPPAIGWPALLPPPRGAPGTGRRSDANAISPRTSEERPGDLAPQTTGFEADRADFLAQLLWDTPPMQGDTYGLLGSLFAFDGLPATADLPVAAAGRRAKIAENSRVLPEDRLFLVYHHFHNSLEADASQFIVGPDRESFSLNRLTFGFEKTWFEGRSAIEVRMPLSSRMDFDTPNFAVEGGPTGNLAMFLKQVVYESPTDVLSAGLGFDLPTGSDAIGQVNGNVYTVKNQAVHLAPFLGYLVLPSPDWFVQGFVQLDFAASGNAIDFTTILPGRAGVLTDPTLLYLDVQLGRWIYRNTDHGPFPRLVSNVAAVCELHWTSALQESDVVAAFQPMPPTSFTFSNTASRYSVFNATLGLHTELSNQTQMRLGLALPITSGRERFFDTELQFVISRSL